MNDLSDNPKEDGYNIVRLFLQYHPNAEADIQSKTKKLANILGKIPEFRELDNRDAMMKNPVIHDFVTLLFVYNDVMKVSATKKARNRKMEEICHLFCDEDGRIKKNKSYFEKNPYIKEAYSFICSIIKYIDKKNKNPKHTNFLQ
jgi:hypothetical protein